jgi:hypothetical protein
MLIYIFLREKNEIVFAINKKSLMDHSVKFWFFNGFNEPEGDLNVTLVVDGNYGIIPFYRCVNFIIINTEHVNPVFLTNYSHITRVSVGESFTEGAEVIITAFPKIKLIQSENAQLLYEFMDKCKTIKRVDQIGGYLDLVRVFIESKINFVYHALSFEELLAIDTPYAENCKNLSIVLSAHYRDIATYVPNFVTVVKLTVYFEERGNQYLQIPQAFMDIRTLNITFLLSTNNANVIVGKFNKLERIEVYADTIDKPHCILREVSPYVEIDSWGNCVFTR